MTPFVEVLKNGFKPTRATVSKPIVGLLAFFLFGTEQEEGELKNNMYLSYASKNGAKSKFVHQKIIFRPASLMVLPH